jgi:hypothetical protein
MGLCGGDGNENYNDDDDDDYTFSILVIRMKYTTYISVAHILDKFTALKFWGRI